eukprot:CAMPEP_0183746668 /NCGR_PEP_ID=MMETSP0737-20130205/66873_1 /TAXON_ID=385413 /ORGANISM="Thalassiosira miniscula, Strain CCMP1093" /LENGTH=795 /DNA_ID=CAMNT_0025982369 /DNA_START=140 /DNA_END=2527 /DNA_ORIENTATION=+
MRKAIQDRTKKHSPPHDERPGSEGGAATRGAFEGPRASSYGSGINVGPSGSSSEMGPRYPPVLQSALGGIGSLGPSAIGAAAGAAIGPRPPPNDNAGIGGHPYTKPFIEAQRDGLNAHTTGRASTDAVPRSFASTGIRRGTNNSLPEMLYNNPMPAAYPTRPNRARTNNSLPEMLYNNPMAAAYPTRPNRAQSQAPKLWQLDMEEIMAKNQRRKEQNQQRASFPGNREFVPTQYSSTQANKNVLGNSAHSHVSVLGNSSHSYGSFIGNSAHTFGSVVGNSSHTFGSNIGRSVIDDFTPGQIMREFSRRQSQSGNTLDNSAHSFSSGVSGSVVDDFTSEEILREISRRQSQRGKSRELFMGMDHSRSTRRSETLSSSNWASMARKQDASPRSQHHHIMSGSSLPPSYKMGAHSNEAKTDISNEGVVMKKISTSTKSAQESSSHSSNSTVVSESESQPPRTPARSNAFEVSEVKIGRKQSESSAGFDALLTAAELNRGVLSKTAESDNKKPNLTSNTAATALSKEGWAGTVKDFEETEASKDQRRSSRSSSLTKYPSLFRVDESKESSSSSQDCAFASTRSDRDISHRNSLPIVRADANNESMVTSFKSMRERETFVGERAVQEGDLRGATSIGGQIHGQIGQVGFAGSSSRLPPLQHVEGSAANAMLARLQGLPLPMPGLPASQHVALHIPRVPVHTENPPATAAPKQKDLKEVLQQFLDEYGEAAKSSCTTMLEAIAKTEKSMAALDEWDRSEGLRKCHSKTVMNTRRSRENLKNFLTGTDPKKKPKKKKRRRKK